MSLEIVPFELYRLAARYEQTKSIRRNCLKYPANPPLYVEIWKQFTGIRTGAPSPLFQKRSKSATDDWSKWRAVSMREKKQRVFDHFLVPCGGIHGAIAAISPQFL